MEQIYSVSQVNNYIKNLFIQDYVLNHIYMKGEVSNCKYHSSGHIYFTLKDEFGQMSCVMFSSHRIGLSFHLAEGQMVIVHGSISVYERDGKYQMYAKDITLDGVGLLYEQFDRLKRKLESEGLFDATHKKSIPKYPERIGIVTARTGAAIWDIIHISGRRNPYVQLILYPAQVQGVGAAKSIAHGIKYLDKLAVDTIIVGRGGGSIEDLWAFNEEIVARAIYSCHTPVISAVGHETDYTISDLVADLRAPTPSAAAELAVNEAAVFLATMVDYHSALTKAMLLQVENQRKKIEQAGLLLSYKSPMHQIRQRREMLHYFEEKLNTRIKQKLESKKTMLLLMIEKMKRLSPLEKLQKGYSYVTDAHGTIITSVTQVEEGNRLQITVTDGKLFAEVTDRIPKNYG